MGAFGVSVWLLERSRGLARGTGRPPKGGGTGWPNEKPSEPSPGRGRGGFLRILRIRGLGLEDSDLQVVPPTLYTLRGLKASAEFYEHIFIMSLHSVNKLQFT